jgi:hypothetical protein
VLPLGAKILYTAFAVATIVGLLVSWRLYGAAVGDAGPAVYYAGAAASAAPAPAPVTPGIELSPEDAAPRRAFVDQIPERKLLEVTHFHLFTIPVYVLVLAHLWLLAKVPPWAQHTGVVAAVIASGLHMAAPWIVRGRPGLSFLMGVSGVAMLGTLGVMAVGSVIDMWLPAPRPPAGARGASAASATGAPSMAEKLAELRKKQAGDDRS